MNPRPIVYEALVAERIKVDYANGIIAEKKVLIERILMHDQEICKSIGESKKYSKKSISKSTLYRFLTKFGLSTPKEYQEEKKIFSVKDKEIETCDNVNDDAESNITSLDEKVSFKSLKFFETNILEDEDAEEAKEQNDNATMMINYQDAKIKELTKICCGLSNKILPSSLLFSSLSSDFELENNRSLHLCIKSLIQVLSPIKPITEWIIDNDFLIVKGITPDDPFQQLANTWLWDGILKYESQDNDQKSEIVKKFGYNIKELCEKHDQIFGTTFTTRNNQKYYSNSSQRFIPPPPQRILDMIIKQHYNHFIDIDLGPNGEGICDDLPNLPFKKIELRPPTNTKPFGKVGFCSWRPSLFSSPIIRQTSEGGGEKDPNVDEEEKEADILFAELNWNKDKLNYVHFAWPQCGEEDVILEKGWHYYTSTANGRREIKTTQSDYQMIGVIWGKQFVGDWIRFDGLLPHLGINNPPVTYIYATKRNTSPENPKQGKWYLCLDDNYVSLMLTNNFQDVLLYMDNDHRRTYRPQLLIFQKLQRKSTIGLLLLQEGGDSSPVSIGSYEPNLQKKKKIWINNSPSDSIMMKTIPNSSSSTIVKQKKKKAMSKNNKPLLMLPKSNTQLTSKKQVIETIDAIINASPLTKEADEKRFFGYDKESQYQKGPGGFQITQTHDQKWYYNTLFQTTTNMSNLN